MPRWFLTLLLTCSTSVFAAPELAPAEATAPLTWAENVSGQLADLGHSMAGQAHDVADRTTNLVSTAMGFLGVPYRRGGTSAETGFDCSGFVRSIFEQTRGLVLPRKAADQARSTEKIDKKDLQPGDLVFFNTMRHAFSHEASTSATASSSIPRAAASGYGSKTCRAVTGRSASTARAALSAVRPTSRPR